MTICRCLVVYISHFFPTETCYQNNKYFRFALLFSKLITHVRNSSHVSNFLVRWHTLRYFPGNIFHSTPSDRQPLERFPFGLFGMKIYTRTDIHTIMGAAPTWEGQSAKNCKQTWTDTWRVSYRAICRNTDAHSLLLSPLHWVVYYFYYIGFSSLPPPAFPPAAASTAQPTPLSALTFPST